MRSFFVLASAAALAAACSTSAEPTASSSSAQSPSGGRGWVLTGYACQFTIDPIDLRAGSVTTHETFTSQPNCQGEYVRTADTTLDNPNQDQLNALLDQNPDFDPTFAQGFSTYVGPLVQDIKACPPDCPLTWIDGPHIEEDNYSGGHYQCLCTDDHGCGTSNAGPGCSPGGGGAVGVYRCGSDFTEGLKCLGTLFFAGFAPGVREVAAMIIAGQIDAAVATAAIIGFDTVVSTLGGLGFDSCACVGTDAFAGCSLNLSEVISYMRDQAQARVGQGNVGPFCSYHTP